MIVVYILLFLLHKISELESLNSELNLDHSGNDWDIPSFDSDSTESGHSSFIEQSSVKDQVKLRKTKKNIPRQISSILRNGTLTCLSPENILGICIPPGECPSLRKLKRGRTPKESSRLKASSCGYLGPHFTEQHCCVYPKPPPKPTAKENSFVPSRKRCLTSFDINSPYCGVSGKASVRIIGGNISERDAWPWIVLLFDKSSNDSFFCEGSLISNFQILTAAHCIREVETSNLIVRLGEFDLRTIEDGKTVEVSARRIIPHENYNPFTQENDIAVVVLERGTCFTDTIRPVCLPDREFGSRDLTGLPAKVAGWGRISSNTFILSDILREVQLEILNPMLCRDIFSPIQNAIISDSVLCAGDPGGGKDACQGDSGSPLVIENDFGDRSTQIGIVSSGVGCGSLVFPGIYTRVSEYMEWISFHSRNS